LEIPIRTNFSKKTVLKLRVKADVLKIGSKLKIKILEPVIMKTGSNWKELKPVLNTF
jgi:hypothetical protein